MNAPEEKRYSTRTEEYDAQIAQQNTEIAEMERFAQSRFGDFLRQYNEGPVTKRLTLPKWVLHKLIPVNSVGTLFGNNNTGKSHLVNDMAMCIANDMDWQGIKTRGGAVFMFCESKDHILARLRAYHKAKIGGDYKTKHRLEVFDPAVLNRENFSLFRRFLESIPKAERPVMLVFDTWSTNFRTENGENSNDDIAEVIERLYAEILPLLNNGTIVTVDHTSKGGDSLRGASAKGGNIDWSIKVKFDTDIKRSIATWEKDRWRLHEGDAMWAGKGMKAEIEFDDIDDAGKTHQVMEDIFYLDFENWSDEQHEDEKKAVEKVKTEHEAEQRQEIIKRKIQHAFEDGGNKPLLVKKEKRVKVPAGYTGINMSDISKSTKQYEAIREFLRETYPTEDIYTERGAECGFAITALEKAPF